MTTRTTTYTPSRPLHLFWVVLLLVALAEMFTAAIQTQVGIVLHAALLVGLLTYSGVAGRVGERNFALALALAPMIRLFSLALPLPRLPQMAWYPAVASLLLVALWTIARQTGATRRSLGLTVGNTPLQITLMLAGLGLGAIEYIILRPGPQPQATSLANMLLLSLNLVLFTGLVEELIFRGLLQSLAPVVLGRWGILYVSLLFGVLHIGWLSFSDVIFVTLVGLLFAQIVRWSGSILGVTLAHGMTNVTLFLLMPLVAQETRGVFDLTVGALVFGSAIVLMMVCSVLATQASAATTTRPLPLTDLRDRRHAQRLSYTELAQRLGIPVRRLAEIELGMKIALPDELRLIAAALGAGAERRSVA